MTLISPRFSPVSSSGPCDWYATDTGPNERGYRFASGGQLRGVVVPSMP
jgi:hypothetical protein